MAQLKANLEAAKANALKLGVSLPKRESKKNISSFFWNWILNLIFFLIIGKLSRKKRRARENAAKAKSDPMAGTAGQKAVN